MVDHENAPEWLRPPPMLPVTVDIRSPQVEVWMRAERDQRGVVSAPHALIRREPGGASEDAAVIAWARPAGTAGWPWVLVTWMDQHSGSRYTSTLTSWRHGWLAFDPLLLEAAGREPHRATEYWRDQRAEAILAAIVNAGLDRRR